MYLTNKMKLEQHSNASTSLPWKRMGYHSFWPQIVSLESSRCCWVCIVPVGWSSVHDNSSSFTSNVSRDPAASYSVFSAFFNPRNGSLFLWYPSQFLNTSIFQPLVSGGLWSLDTLYRLCCTHHFGTYLVDLIRGSAVRQISWEQERNSYNSGYKTSGNVFEMGEYSTHLLWACLCDVAVCSDPGLDQ